LGEWHSKSPQMSAAAILARWRIKACIRDVSTSIAEQMFSWLHWYTLALNNVRPYCHRFIVLHYIRLHNDRVADDVAARLNPFSKKYGEKVFKQTLSVYKYVADKSKAAQAMKSASKHTVKRRMT